MAEHKQLYSNAFYYDIAFERDVSREVEFVLSVYQSLHNKMPGSALEIACGPGYHARALAKRGVQCAGLDFQADMVRLAKVKAQAEALQLGWIVADMRQFQLEQAVDLMLTMFDGLDGLLTNPDLLRHLQAVGNNLNPGGIYIVEIAHPRDINYEHYMDYHYHGERDGVDVEVVWGINHPTFDLVTGTTHTDIQIHVHEADQEVDIFDTAEERVIFPQELRLLADLTGTLKIVGWYGDFDMRQPLDYSPASKHMIVVFQKEEVRKASYGKQNSYISPKLEARQHPEKGRYGVFACEPVQTGELLVMWGGRVVSGEDFRRLSGLEQGSSIQVDEDLYLVPIRPDEAPDLVNHSCNPNAGMRGQTGLEALRPILPGEEVCFDYAMSDGSPYDEFACKCASTTCRGRVTGNDWQLPELWERYRGHFSPYLQRRIDELIENFRGRGPDLGV
jgi:SAM-dependent methyltransferase